MKKDDKCPSRAGLWQRLKKKMRPAQPQNKIIETITG